MGLPWNYVDQILSNDNRIFIGLGSDRQKSHQMVVCGSSEFWLSCFIPTSCAISDHWEEGTTTQTAFLKKLQLQICVDMLIVWEQALAKCNCTGLI